MRDLNKVELLGTISQDLRLATSKSGLSIANIPISTTQVKQNGTEISTYHTIVCFGELADMASEFAVGDRIFASGKIQNESYEKDGQKVRVTKIVASHLGKLLSEGVGEKQGASAPAPGGKPPANFLHGESKPKPTFPFFDAERQLNWPKPEENNCSFIIQGDVTLTCAWQDPENPSKGGSVYEMKKDDTDWQSIGSISTTPPF